MVDRYLTSKHSFANLRISADLRQLLTRIRYDYADSDLGG